MTEKALKPFLDMAEAVRHLPDTEAVMSRPAARGVSRGRLTSLYVADFKALEQWADAQFKTGEWK